MSRTPKNLASKETVILVHGWGGHALVMSYLAHRLRAAGYKTCSLSYPSLTGTLNSNTTHLIQKIIQFQDTHESGLNQGCLRVDQIHGCLEDDGPNHGCLGNDEGKPVIHLVGHSLGGILLLRLLNEFELSATGRVVLLASPVQGSSMAVRARRSVFAGWFLKNLIGADEKAPLKIQQIGKMPKRSVIGIIAGSAGWSFTGGFFGGTEDGDGVIELSETVLEGAHRCEIPCSHTRLVFSRQAADEVEHFLRYGSFTGENATM